MQITIWTLGTGAMAAIMAGALAQQLDYADSLQALSYGNVAMQGNSAGTVWLNITGFVADKLPYIQHNVGIFSLDNLEALQILAGLVGQAASKGQYGDLVFLYNAFAMNGHADYVKVSSDEMQEGLLTAVTPPDATIPDPDLIKLYADTCSSSYISQAFVGLQGQTLLRSPLPPQSSPSSLEKRWIREACSGSHLATKSTCRDLISVIRSSTTLKTGGPRNVCYRGCCISWSVYATFQLSDLTNAAEYCVNYCGNTQVSCEVYGVELAGTILDQCLSNRPDGCG